MDEQDNQAELHQTLVCGIVRRGLEHASDDQLRVECERRDVQVMRDWLWDGLARLGMSEVFSDAQWAARVDVLVKAETERDEWKRRAEAAEAAQAHIMARREARPLAAWSCETGPGIAAMRPDNETWGPSDEDRLCEDA